VIRRFVRWAVRLVVGFVIASVVGVAVYRWVDPPLTPLMVLRAVEARAAGRPGRLTRRWVDLDQISPALLRAVVVAEDARFLEHNGVDLEAVRRAIDYNARHKGRRIRGAGTITMQCARNVFLWPGRSWLRKGLEVYLAHLLELVWGKRRILEVYLNVAEWGDGLYGVEAAARTYFGVPASRLGTRESALLVAVLPDPRRWNPATPTRYIAGRANVIATRAARVRLDALNGRGRAS
jgi:monofunctional biosynthetic peptidoglycan transglycosylase